MNLCAIFTVEGNESKPPILHYLYKEGQNVTNCCDVKRECEELLVYVGGSLALNELSGASAHRHSIYNINSETIGVARREQTCILLIKDQQIPTDDILAALDMVLFIVYSHIVDGRSSSIIGRLTDSIASALNVFLFRFLADSPFALVLLRDYHHLPLPKHIITPILASAALLGHMRVILHSIGGALIRNGRTIVSDVGVFLTNFILIKAAITVFSELPVGQTISSKNYIFLQTLSFDESLGDLSSIRDRIKKLTNSDVHKDNFSNERPQSGKLTQSEKRSENQSESNDDLSLSILSASSGNDSLNETTFSVQLLLVKCVLNSSASTNQSNSCITVALLLPEKTQVDVSHDFMACLVHSLLLIHSRLVDCASYTPVYPSATSVSVSIPLDRSIEAVDPLLPVPVKEAQLSSSKTKRSLSTYSMADFSSIGTNQFSLQEVSMAAGTTIPHSSLSIYNDELGRSYVVAEKTDEDGFILKKKPSENTVPITDNLFSNLLN